MIVKEKLSLTKKTTSKKESSFHSKASSKHNKEMKKLKIEVVDDVENVLNKNNNAEIRLWESPAHLTPGTLMPQFYRMADAVVLMFSPYEEGTIDNLWTWYDSSKQHVSENVPYIFMGASLIRDDVKLKRSDEQTM